MTTISIRHLILTSTLSILLLSHAANGECVICPNGLEYPDAQIPYADGTVSCTQGASIFSQYDRNSCVVTQVDVIPTCCPSQFKMLAEGNVCGWCDDGTAIETLDATFRGPLAGMGDTTCADILPGIALATDTTGCSVYEYAEEYCCPNAQHVQGIDADDQGSDTRDDGSIGDVDVVTPSSNCLFCRNGLEFPSAKPMKGDETPCQEVANIFIHIRSALDDNEMACTNYRQLELTCCPSSIDISNPVGTGGELVAEDIVPREGDDGQSNIGVEITSDQNSDSSNSDRDTEQDVAAVPDDQDSDPVTDSTNESITTDSDSVTAEQSGSVTIDTEKDEAVLAVVDDGSTSEGDGDITNVAAGDLIFNDEGSATVDKTTNTATTNNDVLSTGGEDQGKHEYDIIYPNERSGSLRQTTLGSISIMMSCCVLAWSLQSL
mmetsp:Transcript_16671/g.40628  ORF Transcript_16671/g.40628 Transcript_16671/m.40628 type:complete len:434 (-) Transcript_16671:106-1407(-)